MRKQIVLAMSLGLALVASSVPAQTTGFTPTSGVATYAVRPPVFRVKPGAVVETRTFSKPGDYYEKEGGAWPGEVGPFYVEGATPTTRSSCKILKVRLNRDTAVSFDQARRAERAGDRRPPAAAERPAAGAAVRLAARPRRECRHRSTCPTRRRSGSRSRCSRWSAAWRSRPRATRRSAGCGRAHSAATWTPPTSARAPPSTCPIFHDGALFYFGDIHAAQGDGEVCGSGLETTAEVTLQFELIKGKRIAWPRIEDATHIMVAGSGRPLIDAFRIAHVELIEWLAAEYGFEKMEGYQVVSQAGTARIGNVVDPLYTVVAKFPKALLPARR